jgi:hypothetical protein
MSHWSPTRMENEDQVASRHLAKAAFCFHGSTLLLHPSWGRMLLYALTLKKGVKTIEGSLKPQALIFYFVLFY